MESGIYSIINIINGKRYIGSAKNFNKRRDRHFSDLSKNSHCNIKLQRSWNKNGSDKFIFEIIEFCPYEKETIVDLENYYIKYYNSKEFGYNIADASFGDVLTNHPDRLNIIKKIKFSIDEKCSNMTQEEKKQKFGRKGEKNGMFSKTHSDKTRDKISKSHIERNKKFGPSKKPPFSDSHRKKMSENAKLRTGEKNSFYGKKHSEETKLKISNKNKNREHSKKVFINGVLFKSCKEASEITGIKMATIYWRIKSENTKFKDYFFA